ncbi:hypothetical protein [Streptomyces sp. NPDC003077]|uniref:hypothetical protein n=1 Tax=Streptomyces sp. NPDC003077 TaxID=3154443 RepID=UPI0033B027F5
MLDFGDKGNQGGRSVEDADAGFGLVLEEPLAGRRQDGRVQEVVADEHVRPGVGFGCGRRRRTRVSGGDGVSSVVGR